MKRVLILFWLLSCSLLGVAQEGKMKAAGQMKSGLNGTWKLDNSKSDLGSSAHNPLATADVTMTIEINEPEVHLSRNMIVNGQEHIGDWLYYTDGRGETNSAFLSGSGLKTITKWSGSKLVSTASFDLNASGNAIHVEAKETWELSRDGKTLINSISTSNPRGTEIFKLVYKRTP